LIDRLLEGLRVPDDLAHGCLIVRRQQAIEGQGNHGHRLQRDMVAVDPLQIRPCPATIFGRGGAFATRADGINTTGIERHDRLELEVTDPVIDEVVHVAEALPAMEA